MAVVLLLTRFSFEQLNDIPSAQISSNTVEKNKKSEWKQYWESYFFVLYILSHSNAARTTELGDACFSNTYHKVQQMSDEVWRFYRLSLIHEYCDRPFFVAPLIVLSHVYRTIRYSCSCDRMFDRCKRWKPFSK